MNFDAKLLLPGDSLGYYGDTPVDKPGSHAGFVDWSIAVKTGYWTSHVEVYAGANLSFASRNGIGVNRYQLRTDGLIWVRRPLAMLDLSTANEWFASTARGQKYDFKGLMCFYLAVREGSPRKMFCSEFQLRYYRKASFQPVHCEVDADRTPPSMAWISEEFSTEWLRPGFEP